MDNNSVRFYIRGYNRSGSNQSPFSDSNTGQDYAMRANPNTILNDNLAPQISSIHRPFVRIMACRGNFDMRPNHYSTTNLNTAEAPHVNKRSYDNIVANFNLFGIENTSGHSELNVLPTGFQPTDQVSALPVLQNHLHSICQRIYQEMKKRKSFHSFHLALLVSRHSSDLKICFLRKSVY